MKLFISTLYLLSIPLLSAYSPEQLSADFENKFCSINQSGNKVCSFENGCYEYFNKSGIRYHYCPEDEYHNELKQFGLTSEGLSMGLTCEKSFPGTSLKNSYCVCDTDGTAWNNDFKMCLPYKWEKEIILEHKGSSLAEKIGVYGGAILLLIGILYCFHENKIAKIRFLEEQKKRDEEEQKLYDDKEKSDAEEKESKRIKHIEDRPEAVSSYDDFIGGDWETRNSHKTSANGYSKEISLWYKSLSSEYQGILEPLYLSICNQSSKAEILKLINEYYEKNLSHIYSSDDKVYQDLFSLKEYL